MAIHRRFPWIAVILLSAGFAAAQPRGNATNDPDLKEIRDYRLNMDIVQKYIRVAKAATADPAAKKCFDNNPPTSLNAGEKMITACPPFAAHLSAAGVKPREFLIITAALIGDYVAVGMKKKGTIKEYPPSISPANAAFIEQNYDKLQTLLAPLTGGEDK